MLWSGVTTDAKTVKIVSLLWEVSSYTLYDDNLENDCTVMHKSSV